MQKSGAAFAIIVLLLLSVSISVVECGTARIKAQNNPFTSLPHVLHLVNKNDSLRGRITVNMHEMQYVASLGAVKLMILKHTKNDTLEYERHLPKLRVCLVMTANSVECCDSYAYTHNTSLPHINTYITMLFYPLSSKIRHLAQRHRNATLTMTIDEASVTFAMNMTNPIISRNWLSTRIGAPIKRLKTTMSVCITGVLHNMIPYLREIVQLHLKVGITHIYIGVFDERDFYDAQLELHDHIHERRVSLKNMARYTTPYIDPLKLDAQMKNPFALSCLYQSKAWDSYTGIVDVDEFWVSPSLTPIVKLLDDIVLKKRTKQTTSHVCTLETPSYNLCVNPVHQEEKRLNRASLLRMPRVKQFFIETFNTRRSSSDTRTPKMIVRTQYAKSVDIHSGGNCEPWPVLSDSNNNTLGTVNWNDHVAPHEFNSTLLYRYHAYLLGPLLSYPTQHNPSRMKGCNPNTSTIDTFMNTSYYTDIKETLTTQCLYFHNHRLRVKTPYCQSPL